MIGVSYSYFQVNKPRDKGTRPCALTTGMVQIHENCCNYLSFNDRKFMVQGGDVRKAMPTAASYAEDKEASQEKTA